MNDFPSWSDERSLADASWSSAPSHPPSVIAPAAYPPYQDSGYGQGAGYGYGGGPGYDRPRFAEDGRGQPFSGHLSKPAPGGPPGKEVSYDTSSRDPAMLRARVFIGSLGKGAIVREDIIELCRPFGTVLAVTLFKKQGYAFVQFADANDADIACEALNNRRWKGITIDVHLAMEGLVKKTLPQKRPAPAAPAGGGRPVGKGGHAGDGGSYNKKAKTTNSAGIDEEPHFEINEQNKKMAAGDSTDVADLAGSEMADTLICGTCRFVTADFIAFREHRKKNCVKPKDSVEPPVLKCASCGLRFLTAWKMLFHLTDFHRMALFKPDYSSDAIEKAKGEEDKYKSIQEARMKEFFAEHNKQQEEQKTTESTEDGSEPKNGTAEKTEPATENKSSTKVVEKVTTGADYDEDEEDDDDGAMPANIPTLG